MAITATFLASFDQFVNETKRADTALHGLGASATKVAADSSSSFAGMGATVRSLASAFGVGLSIGAVVSFGKSVFDAASTIHDMGLKLGISSEAVQGFKFAAEQAGSTIESVGTAITRMNVNLSEGSKSTVAALTAAGLEFSKIRSMKPEDAFLAIADAIQKIPDPMVRSEVALQLFGRSAADLLPAIMDGFRKTADEASKMSNETTKSLADAQDAWAKVGNQFVITTGTMIGKLIEFWGTLREQNFGGFGNAAKKAAVDIELLPPVLAKVTVEAEKVVSAADKLEIAWKKANATAVAKMESDSRNAQGMAQMNADIATQERAVQNLEAVWLMEADAATAATAARMQQIAQEIAGVQELTVALAGLTIVGTKYGGGALPTTPHGSTGLGGSGGGISGSDLSAYGESVKQARLVPRGFSREGDSTVGGMTINVNAQGSFYDTPESVQRFAAKVGDAVTAGLRSQGRQL